ncbi:sugar ABC transporter ATP-binding protein [Fodinicola feengrottensis]|uniref:Sugar ABC transporter ATP-binding protein n=1 Tax=Fodinicola feengrottensis TaxID=435914 RepID=A0ABP4TMI0_9ACTN
MNDNAARFAVEMRGVRKAFNGVPVLAGVDFALRHGETHALVGENGAGKSTLMKILQGVYQLESGDIRIDGKTVRLRSTQDARAAGIGMVFQEFSLIPTLSVARNIFLNREPRDRFGLLRDRESVRRTRELFADMGVDLDPNAMLGSVGTAYWQLTEIAKALAQKARVLIMDEPTASLAKTEADALFALLERLKARGISVIYISHRMNEIYRIADRVTVLRDGRNVITATCGELTAAELVEHIVGRRLDGALVWRPRKIDHAAAPLLEVRNLTAGPRVRDVTFTLAPGEIVGLAGLMGSGRTELARCLFGIDRATKGDVFLRGQRVKLTSPRAAISAGLALIPEDRRAQGLVLEHSVRDNLLLPLLPRLNRGPLIDDRKGRKIAGDLIQDLQVRLNSSTSPVKLLSGGNQQKVVIAKWLATKPAVLIMDEPTAGVDIGTKTDIIAMIRQAADEGLGVIVISSELPELLAISDRVLILRDGTVERILPREDISSEETLQAAVQGVDQP